MNFNLPFRPAPKQRWPRTSSKPNLQLNKAGDVKSQSCAKPETLSNSPISKSQPALGPFSTDKVTKPKNKKLPRSRPGLSPEVKTQTAGTSSSKDDVPPEDWEILEEYMRDQNAARELSTSFRRMNLSQYRPVRRLRQAASNREQAETTGRMIQSLKAEDVPTNIYLDISFSWAEARTEAAAGVEFLANDLNDFVTLSQAVKTKYGSTPGVMLLNSREPTGYVFSSQPAKIIPSELAEPKSNKFYEACEPHNAPVVYKRFLEALYRKGGFLNEEKVQQAKNKLQDVNRRRKDRAEFNVDGWKREYPEVYPPNASDIRGCIDILF